MGLVFRVGMIAGKVDRWGRLAHGVAGKGILQFIISLGFAQSDEQQKELPHMTALQSSMERAMGIEPTSRAWEARILPMNYARGRLASRQSRRPIHD